MFQDRVELSDISRPQRDPNYPGSPTKTTIECITIAVVLLVLLNLPYIIPYSMDPSAGESLCGAGSSAVFCILLLCTVTTTAVQCSILIYFAVRLLCCTVL